MRRTSARLYGVDAPSEPCRFTPEQFEDARQASSHENRTLGPVTPRDVAAVKAAHGW